MKHTPIHSKWHKIADPLQCNISLEVNGYNGLDGADSNKFVDNDVIVKLFRLYDTLPKYVMYDDIVELVSKDNSPLQKSVKVMMNAGLAHLPFPELLVEFSTRKEVTGNFHGREFKHVMTAREFVWLGEKPKGHIKGAEEYPFWAMPMTVIEPADMSRPMIVLNANCLVAKYLKDPYNNGGDQLGLEYRCYTSPFIKYDALTLEQRRSLLDANTQNAMWSTSCAITAVIALLRTKGIVQEKIEAPAKLNKHRASAGKPLIRDHTVIRIGHVYDREGNAHEYKSTGKQMPVHWRSGHIRNQRFGPGLSKSYELFIEPMLINYTEGDKVPTPIKEVTV